MQTNTRCWRELTLKYDSVKREMLEVRRPVPMALLHPDGTILMSPLSFSIQGNQTKTSIKEVPVTMCSSSFPEKVLTSQKLC
jgi:hypothetical protein